MRDKVTKKLTKRQAARRKNSHNVLLAFVFLLILLIFFIVNLCVRTKDFSEAENRNLAQMPEFSGAALMDGSYFSGLSEYYTDQFFARDGWISMKLWMDSRLGRTESGTVFLGEDGYLISPPAEPNQEQLSKTSNSMVMFSQRNPTVNMHLMLIPDAAAVMPQLLPANAPVRNQLRDIDNFINMLSGTITSTDVGDALMAHGTEQLYYRTDHHWTSLGAKYAFEASAGDLGISAPATEYDVYTVSETFEGTLASKSGSHSAKDTIEVYSPKGTDISYYVTYSDQSKVSSLYQRECLDVKDQYTVFFGGNHPIVEISTTANNDRNLLVFKDSYANCFMQFLVPYYEKIIMIDPRYYYDSVSAVMAVNGITDVLFLYSADTLFQDTALADVLNDGSV